MEQISRTPGKPVLLKVLFESVFFMDGGKSEYPIDVNDKYILCLLTKLWLPPSFTSAVVYGRQITAIPIGVCHLNGNFLRAAVGKSLLPG